MSTRTLLKDDAADMLRDSIISGRIYPGAKLVERQLAKSLGVSRMPIRDALIKLEEKGLVVNRPAGRYVIEVSPDETRQLMQVRSTLEVLHTDLAARSIGEQDRRDMEAALVRMSAACDDRQQVSFTQADLEIHETIWRASNNKYLSGHCRTFSARFWSRSRVPLRFSTGRNTGHSRRIGRRHRRA